MSLPNLEPLANESLCAFAQIADKAEEKLNAPATASEDSFAVSNSLTGGKAIQNLQTISKSNQDGWRALIDEPAIARLLLEDENGEQKIFYISRHASLPLAGDTQLASYASPIGRMAALPVGDEGEVIIRGVSKRFYLVEKTSFHACKVEGEWDSRGNEYRHESLGVFSVESLRALLALEGVDAGDELDRLLEQDAAISGVVPGITHQIRTAMGLRDQPILDKFQDDIFRLPLDSQLIILGPPGTGKTTTLIKRLGQKLDKANLDEVELRLAEANVQGLPFESNWLMFTPSELLKHYLKEAFSREQVPASNEHIKTWDAYRHDLARNSLGILKTPNGGKFTLKASMDNLAAAVLKDPRVWYEPFRQFHVQRLQAQFKQGADIVVASDDSHPLAMTLTRWVEDLSHRELADCYRDLNALEPSIKSSLDAAKASTDELLTKERNRIFNHDKDVFAQLAKFLATVQQDDDELSEDDEFDADEAEEAANATSTELKKAVAAYVKCLKALARYKYLKRSLPKNGVAAKIRDWLSDRVPSDAILLTIGQSISFQNGLRRFVNASKRYAFDVPTSYRLFRKTESGNTDFYQQAPVNQFQLNDTEVDAVVLLMLRNGRELLGQTFIARELNAPRFESLRNLASLFRHQIMVDEATDFSALQLACMESLTSLETLSFFACGDFNQRITQTGVRSSDQLEWVSSAIEAKKINVVYRQSRILNDFAASLLTMMGGDESALGVLPEHSIHEGVPPVLLEHAIDISTAAQWVAERIFEVEQSVKQMPTIAVLVNDENDVKPMAELLTTYLEDITLKAVACEEGKALGEGTDVRVFDIKHIKGLEFEAVFFVGVDTLAQQKAALFDRFLYVGTTRAATYLGMACYDVLPEKMHCLRGSFVDKW